MREFVVKIKEVYAFGNMAHEMGKIVLFGRNGEVVSSGKCMTLWKKEDGEWKIFRDMGN